MHLKRKIYKKGKRPNLKKKLSGGGLNGKSSGMSLAEVAKMHDMDYEDFLGELKMGTTHELEHTSDKKVAERIALDHLYEDPKYYEKLESVGLKHGGKPKEQSYRWIYSQNVLNTFEGGTGTKTLKRVLTPENVKGIKVVYQSSPYVKHTTIKIFATDQTSLRKAGEVLKEHGYIESVKDMEDSIEYFGEEK